MPLDINLALELGPGMEKDLESDETLAPLRDGRFTWFLRKGKKKKEGDVLYSRQLDLEIDTISYKDTKKVSE